MGVLIGSRALGVHIPGARPPKDWDYFSPVPIAGAETFWHPAMADYWSGRAMATLDELYTIKLSHIFWDSPASGRWDKHMYDIVFMQEHNATWVPELYRILYKIWEERYGAKRVNLDAAPEDFFTNRIARVYEHDSIHESIAYHDKPLFLRVLADGRDVMVDWTKFLMLDSETQCQLVREEVYATALERILIPNNYKGSPGAAYAGTLKKIITSLWTGRWALWVAMSYADVRKPDVDYVALHKSNANKLRRLT